MDRRTRKTIFYSLCLTFLAAGTLVVLYAQGWRLDLESFRVQKVGGIYLRSFPKDADIFLNDKYVDKKPGLLDSGRFINSLFPKNYKLKLSGTGYMDWAEHVEVSPSLVTELKYAVLIPKGQESAYKGQVRNFSVDNGQLITSSGDSLIFNGKKIKGDKVIFQNGNSRTALTENSAGAYFINYLNGDTPTSTALASKFASRGIAAANIKEIMKDPGSDNSAIFRTASRVFLMNLQTGNISPLASSTQTITGISASPSWLAWINLDAKTGKSKISFYNRDSASVQNETAIPGTAVKISFGKENAVGILQSDGSFYIASPDNGLQKTADDARDFTFSKSGNIVALRESQAVEIFAFNSDKDYWRFRLPDAENIQRLEWYGDENHLFVVYPGEIKFLDLKDAGVENFQTAASGYNPSYDLKANTLYFIKNGTLLKLVFPK